MAQVLTKTQRETAVKMYQRGITPTEIGDQYGVSAAYIVQTARRAGAAAQCPKLATACQIAKRRRASLKKSAEEKEMSALRRAAGLTNHAAPSQLIRQDVVERLMAEIPSDTRGLTAYFFGDPLPGRSALDRRTPHQERQQP